MQYSIAEFDDLIKRGAEYFRPSRAPATSLNMERRRIEDTPNDFVVLENALLTRRCGLAWKDLWLAPAIHYMAPTWMRAPWLPGTVDEVGRTITIPDDQLSPKQTLDGPYCYVDWAGGKSYGHYIHDTLPYGSLFQRIRSIFPNVRPLVGLSKNPYEPKLFAPVFDFPLSDAESIDLGRGPVLIRHLILGRRQTDMASRPDLWNVSCDGWRHVRNVARQKWGKPTSNGLKVFFHRYQSPEHIEFLKKRNWLHGRDFTNMGALLEMLVDNGFIGFEPGKIPIEAIVDITTQAETIVSIHGSGLANLIFAPEMTRVFEIRSYLGAWLSLQCMATVLGHKFQALPQPKPAADEPPFLDLQFIREQVLGKENYSTAEVHPDLERSMVRAIRRGFLGKNHDSYNILASAELLACFDAGQYYLDHMSACVAAASDFALLENAVKWQKVDGLILEFGVASGRTTNHLASLLPNKRIFGFDWFQGLPETWRAGFNKGAFSSAIPEVRENVELVHGLFENTLSQFVDTHPGPVALLHVDCDLYSSTKTIFRYLAKKIVSGTVIVFDEYFNYSGWRLHEYKAFQEFVADDHRTYEYLGFVPNHQQVCVRIL